MCGATASCRRIRASRRTTAAALRGIGLGTGQGSDGTSHLVATVYADTAHLSLGTLDLTGVSRVTVELRSPAKHPFTIELRDGSPTGAVLGSAEVNPASTGQWYTQSVPLSARGDHTLYVMLRTSVKDIGQFNNLVAIDGLRFER